MNGMVLYRSETLLKLGEKLKAIVELFSKASGPTKNEIPRACTK